MAIEIINSGRARVIVKVTDDSFVNLFSEGTAPFLAAFLTDKGGTAESLIDALGTTSERQLGFIRETSVENWVARLQDPSFLQAGAGRTYANPNALGPSADWYAAQNYLLYGGDLVITGTADAVKDLDLGCIFATTPDKESDLDTALADRDNNCIAIYPAGGSGEGEGTADIVTSLTDNEVDRHKFFVFGYKKHLDYRRNPEAVGNNDLITTSCTPDVAGCFARTERDFNPFMSPAGFKRGRILDVLRLVHNPTPAQQDALYDDGVNPVVSFPGEGTFLFGDRTKTVATSTFSRVNVARLFVHLKKTIGRVAREILFDFNDDLTRTNFTLQCNTILRAIQAQRGIFDYKVVCDESNNPPAVVDANIFNADIFIKPAKSINFIQLTFTNKNTADDISGGLSDAATE
jgi:hypothetical protein